MKSDKAAKAVGITDYAVLAVTGGHAPDKWRIDETIVRIYDKLSSKILWSLRYAMPLNY